MSEYQTIKQSFIANGDRYLQRANRYLSDGNVEYAEGSLAKAKKSYNAAKSLNIAMENYFLQPMITQMAQRLANHIMNGY